MQSSQDLKIPSLPNAWADLQAEPKMADWLTPEAHRLAFADPEFLLRRETRGIRFELEMLKPELELARQGIEHTVVVFGSARFVSPEMAAERMAQAQKSTDATDTERAQRDLRNSVWYDQSRQFARLVASTLRSGTAFTVDSQFSGTLSAALAPNSDTGVKGDNRTTNTVPTIWGWIVQ